MKLHKFRGQDVSMITSREHRIGNTIFVCLSVDETNNSIYIYDKLLLKIINILNNSKHPFRARQHDDQHYYYTTTKSEILARQIVKIIDYEPTHLELGQMLIDEDLTFIYRIYKNNIYMASTHLFFDGIQFGKCVQYITDKDFFDLKLIPDFKYYPIITELSILPSIFKMIVNMPKRNLSYDVSWKTNRMPHCIKKYIFELSDFMLFKRYLETCFDNKIGFSTVMSILCTLFILEYTDKNKITIGLVSAFNNPKRFNNFAACTININRSKNWNKINNIEKIQNIAKQIIYSLEQYGKAQSLLIYLITNIYELNFYANNYVDCLISGFPSRFPILYNNKPVIITGVELLGTSMPMYIGYGSSNNQMRIFINSRSYDIKLKDDTPFILDSLLEDIKKTQKSESDINDISINNKSKRTKTFLFKLGILLIPIIPLVIWKYKPTYSTLFNKYLQYGNIFLKKSYDIFYIPKLYKF